MYLRKDEAFGSYTQITLLNEASGNGFSVVPEVGGTILDLQFSGQAVLDGCANSLELGNNNAYKNALLFPFPNRLDGGTYAFNGEEYSFPINDAGTNNALHGFGREVSMDVLKVETTETSASIILSYFYEGDQNSYPFPFLFDVTYSMDEATGFRVDLKCTNEANQRIPVGIGWHPYFKMGTPVNIVDLQLPPCKMIEIDHRMLPTGQLLDYDYFSTKKLIQKAVLDNGFYLDDQTQPSEVVLSNQLGTLRYWQETGTGKFNFLQVYTPASRESIAIEPMTCNIDAFNNGDGLQILAPESFIEASCGVVFTKNSTE